MTAIESPCILVCSIDMKSGYCIGCGRTGSEIAGWIAMSPPERRRIMDTLGARLEKMEGGMKAKSPATPGTRQRIRAPR